MELIERIDTYLFLIIHNSMARPLSDAFFSELTDFHNIPLVKEILFPVIIALWIYFRKTVGAVQVLLLIIGILTSDVLCHRVIKPLVARPRPQYSLIKDQVTKKSESGTSQYGFPSNHTSNAFVACVLLSSFFPMYRLLFFFIACLIGYSRVYLGVHFPLDVLGGAFVGTIIGLLILEFDAHMFFSAVAREQAKKMTLRKRMAGFRRQK